MKKLLLLLCLWQVAILATGQTNIISGGGECKVDGDPDLNAKLAVADVGMCWTAIDTLTGNKYDYHPGDPEGERWDLVEWSVSSFTGGGDIIYKDDIDSLIVNANYNFGEKILLRDYGTQYRIVPSAEEFETDSLFVIELNLTDRNHPENLFGNSNDLAQVGSQNGKWAMTGGGSPDLEPIRNLVLNPDSTCCASGIYHAPISNDLFVHYLSDTIYANTQYYLSFFFRASTSTPPSGVTLNRLRFREANESYIGNNTSVNLNTSDTIWRRYEVEIPATTQDILPGPGSTDGAVFDFRLTTLAEGDTVYFSNMSLTRDSTYEYIETPSSSTIKKGRAYAFLDLSSRKVNLHEIPPQGTEVQTAQKIIDYAEKQFTAFTLNIPHGLRFTPLDTTLFMRQGTSLQGVYKGNRRDQIDDSYVFVDLDNADVSAIEVLPNLDDNDATAVGVNFYNLRFEVESPCNIVIDAKNVLQGDIYNTTMELYRNAKIGVRYGPETWTEVTDEKLNPLNNTLYNLRIFEASETAGLFSGGALNSVWNSQFHRSNKGAVIEGGTWQFHNTQFEKLDTMGLHVKNGDLVQSLGCYYESPNYEGVGVAGVVVDKCNTFNYIGNSYSTATSTTDHAVLIDTVQKFNAIGNMFNGDYQSDTLLRILQPDLTKKSVFGNNTTLDGRPEAKNSLADMELVAPVIESADILGQTVVQGGYLTEDIKLARAVIQGDTNYVRNSENLAAGWVINASRLTVDLDDIASPYDSELTADKVTLTASTSAKLMQPPLSADLDSTSWWNIKFAIKPGNEAFNDNLSIEGQYALAEGGSIPFSLEFDPSFKEWQFISKTMKFERTPSGNTFQFRVDGDADDYFWFTAVQVSKARTETDYQKTSGGIALIQPKITAPDGLNFIGQITADNWIKSTATLDFTNTTAGTVQELTVNVTGTSQGDLVDVIPLNATVAARGSWTGRVSAIDTVSVKFHNDSSSDYDPPSGDYNIIVTKF